MTRDEAIAELRGAVEVYASMESGASIDGGWPGEGMVSVELLRSTLSLVEGGQVTPGIKAVHTIITDECRKNRTDEVAIDVALRRVREEFLNCAPLWDLGKNTKFHVVLTVERHKETP